MRRNLSRASVVVTAVVAVLAAPGNAPARAWPTWLHPCGADQRCGTFTVPLDRASPEAGSLGLNVVVVPALSAGGRAAEALSPITGGPGGASTTLAGWARSTFYDTATHRDILLVDQRGTGKSKPLFCPDPAVTTASSPARVRAYWTACLGAKGADPRLFTTAVAMDDLDDVRGALGYPQLDLYGVSYGATAVQYYLLLHGDRVRTAILDGGTLLDIPIFERYAHAGQTMLDRLFARCASQTACHRAFPSPAADLRTLLARVGRAPLRVNGVTIRRDDVATGVQYLSRNPDTAAKIPLLLHRAATGGLASVLPAIEGMAPKDTSNAQVMSWAIKCSEPWARFGRAEAVRLGAGSYLGPSMVASARYAEAICSTMPGTVDVPGADHRVPSNVPALVLVGGQDPQDPLENIAGITRVMPNAKVVVVRGAGHGAINHGCAERLADTFVQKGSAAGLDPSCAAKAPLTPFALR